MKLFLLLLALITSSVLADNEPNNNCNQVEVIQELHNLSSSRSFTETGSVYSSDKNDFYTFTLRSQGVLQVNISATKNIRVRAGSSCNEDDIYDGWTYKKSHSFTYIITSTSQPIYLRINRKFNFRADYTISVKFTAVDAIVNTTDDICHTEVESVGRFCVDAGPCAAGLNCRKEVGIRNLSDRTLESVNIYYDESNLGGSFGNSCGVEPSGNCETEGNVDLPMVDLLGQSTHFEFDDPIEPNNSEEKIWVQNFASGSCFGYEKFYGYYIIDGVLHYGKIKNCSADERPRYLYREKDFELINPRPTRLLNGNIITIGNTVLCPKVNGICLNDTEKTNADLDLRYIDIDSDVTTYNSSRAKITLPKNSVVKWAGLFIQGYLHYSYYSDDRYSIGYNRRTGDVNAEDVENTLLEPIKFKAPFHSNYVELTPSEFYLLPNKDYYWNNIAGYTYEAFIDITHLLEGKTDQDINNGWFYVGNIKAQEHGTRIAYDGLGNYGAWSLVIIYSNESEKLRNLSVFNGYKEISRDKPNVDIEIEGFYTPSSGDVDAKLSVFAGEGDKNIDGDKLILDGVILPNNTDSRNNFFNSFVSTSISRDPNLTNNNGIDIQELRVGKDGDNSHPQIIGNSQTQAEFTFTSDQDKYFPSMLSFAVEMYKPLVCYYEELYTEDGTKVTPNTSVNVGDKITAKLTIKNLGNEIARNVEIAKTFESSIEYVPNSTKVQDADWNSFHEFADNSVFNDVHVDYQNDRLHIYYLGDGGASTTFSNNDTVYINFDFTIEDEQNITLTYQTSYTYTVAGIEKKLTDDKLPPCEDFNNTIIATIVATGAFDAWDSFRDISDRNISTKVVNKNFSLTIASLNENNNGTEKKNDISVKYRIYSLSKFLPLTSFNTFDASANDTITANFTVGSSDKNATVQFLFCGAKNNDKIIFKPLNECENIAEPTELQLKSNYPCAYDINNTATSWKTICSSDQFAIRPEKFSITVSTPTIVAGKDFNITFKALDGNNAPTQGFNNSITEFNLTTKERKIGCITGSFNPSISTGWNFSQGQKILTTKYNEVGILDLNLSEKTPCNLKFAAVDCDDGDKSPYWTKDSNLSIKENSIVLFFKPHHFKISSKVVTSHNSAKNYTYIDTNNTITSMASNFTFTIEAQNEKNVTTQNYNGSCYANDINITITHSNIPNKIKKIITSEGNFDIDKNITFNINKNKFVSGQANHTLLFNLQRNITTPTSPFIFTITNLHIYDPIFNFNEINGSINQNTNFYSVRLHIPTQVITGASGDIKAYYEIYTEGSDPAGIKGRESIDDVNWYINTAHTANDGNVTSPNGAAIDPKITLTQKKSINAGEQNLTLQYTGQIYPYAKTFYLNTQSWLVYDKYDANATGVKGRVIFNRSGSWLGKGSRDTSSDTELAPPKNENSRILW